MNQPLLETAYWRKALIRELLLHRWRHPAAPAAPAPVTLREGYAQMNHLVTDQLKAHPDRPVIVVVDGFSQAGKSSFVSPFRHWENLSDPVPLFGMDDARQQVTALHIDRFDDRGRFRGLTLNAYLDDVLGRSRALGSDYKVVIVEGMYVSQAARLAGIGDVFVEMTRGTKQGIYRSIDELLGQAHRDGVPIPGPLVRAPDIVIHSHSTDPPWREQDVIQWFREFSLHAAAPGARALTEPAATRVPDQVEQELWHYGVKAPLLYEDLVEAIAGRILRLPGVGTRKIWVEIEGPAGAGKTTLGLDVAGHLNAVLAAQPAQAPG